MSVGSLKRVRFQIAHGITKTAPARQATTARRDPGAPVDVACSQCQRNGDDREQQDQLVATERGDPADRPEHTGVAQCRVLPEAVHGVQRAHDREDDDRLRQEDAVVDPQLGVDRRDAGGDKTGGRTGQPVSEQTDDRDRGDAEERRCQPVTGDGVDAELDQRPRYVEYSGGWAALGDAFDPC